MKTSKKGFTLIELLVVISVIGLLLTGLSNLNFNFLANEQKLEIMTNAFIAQYEEVRNLAVLWKGISHQGDGNIVVPTHWYMDMSIAGGGKVIRSYQTGSLSPITPYKTEDNLTFSSDDYTINTITCYDIHKTTGYNVDSLSTGRLILHESTITLDGASACQWSTRIIELDFSFRGVKQTIEINTLNGLITRVK